MKNLWIIVLVVTLGSIGWAAPLDDKLKAFTEAVKTSSSAKADPDSETSLRSKMVADQLALAGTPERGGTANLEAMVKQLMATNSSESVQKTGKALLDEIAAEKKARADAFTAQVNAVLARIQENLIKAEKPKDLDGMLADLQKIQTPQGAMYGYDTDSQNTMNKVNSAYQFVAQWQDYLSARSSGNIQEAQNSLRNMLNSRQAGDVVLIPRSEILARGVELANPPKSGTKAATPATPPAVDVGAILDGIKTLDDMPSALNALRPLPNQGYTGQGADLQQLTEMANLYAGAKSGLPVSLDVPRNQPGYNASRPELERVKAMLYLYLLPRFIGSNALTPNPDETVNGYLKRSYEDAVTKQDWDSLRLIADAGTKVTKAAAPNGTRNFIAGLNQDLIGQYALAVSSYQTAIRDPDDYTPVKVAGDRLAAIKKDHSAEYEDGMKRYLNPPTPTYINPYYLNPAFTRQGMPGYVNPTGIPATNISPVAPVVPVAPSVSTNAATTAPVAPAAK